MHELRALGVAGNEELGGGAGGEGVRYEVRHGGCAGGGTTG